MNHSLIGGISDLDHHRLGRLASLHVRYLGAHDVKSGVAPLFGTRRIVELSGLHGVVPEVPVIGQRIAAVWISRIDGEGHVLTGADLRGACGEGLDLRW